VNFGLDGAGRLYLRAEPHSLKIKRLMRNPTTRLCVCTFRGKPRGPLVEGRARVVSQPEEERALRLIARNWRKPDMLFFEKCLDAIGVPEAYVEITPSGLAGRAERSV
jgi:PPOX class probable F420-dependent enzyme